MVLNRIQHQNMKLWPDMAPGTKPDKITLALRRIFLPNFDRMAHIGWAVHDHLNCISVTDTNSLEKFRASISLASFPNFCQTTNFRSTLSEMEGNCTGDCLHCYWSKTRSWEVCVLFFFFVLFWSCGPPTTMRMASTPATITKPWKTSVQTTAFMPPWRKKSGLVCTQLKDKWGEVQRRCCLHFVE